MLKTFRTIYSMIMDRIMEQRVYRTFRFLCDMFCSFIHAKSHLAEAVVRQDRRAAPFQKNFSSLLRTLQGRTIADIKSQIPILFRASLAIWRPSSFKGISSLPCRRWTAFQSVFPCLMIYNIINNILSSYNSKNHKRIADSIPGAIELYPIFC